ncbi:MULTISPECIES: hypothetical protein [unclassified Brevibacterium]|uniref:hypothetical protein n=1 Tax=unclassified Brevibacterium TaxID=2614124 RepID=UPI000C53E960|nr:MULTISPECIES: hypothetical protein [unclassified Brevibacterium]SMX70915.1 DNA-binding transcriptional regulator, MarR family [Brevibacterium sp. 239c]
MNSEHPTLETADAAPNLDAALLLAGAKSSLDTVIGTALSRVGLSLDDLRRLRIIGARPQGLTRENLAEAMGETRSSTVRSSLPLVKLGWLSRSESGDFTLTDSGRVLIDQAEGIAENAASRWFTDTALSPAEVISTLTSGSGVNAADSRR